jgi:signal transduction histidine kinase/ActR/RegA family two-component response regulator
MTQLPGAPALDGLDLDESAADLARAEARRARIRRIGLVRLGWAGVAAYVLFLLLLDRGEQARVLDHGTELQPWARLAVALLMLVITAAIVTWRAWVLADRAARAESEQARTERLTVLGRLAAGISHDTANTLALVAGQAEVAAEALRAGRLDTGEALRALEEIHRAAIGGAEMVRRLQHFGRMTPLNRTAVDPNALVDEVIDLTRPRWRDEALARGATVQVETLPEARRPILVCAPEVREALVNLIFNAIDAMPSGGRLTLSTRDEEGCVAIEVADTGVGMEEGIRQRIFEPFYSTKALAGTGLGLAMVHGIIQRAGGRIAVESAPGLGSRFTLWLPVAEGGIAPVAPPARPTRTVRILAIDDEPGLVGILTLMLEQAGHSVAASASGREALKLLDEQEFDLVLTDLSMPEMSGWEVAEAVKRLRPGTPVGLITGWGTVKPEELSQRGVDGVLAKPYRGDELYAFVDRLVGGAPSALKAA